jgi:protease-4
MEVRDLARQAAGVLGMPATGVLRLIRGAITAGSSFVEVELGGVGTAMARQRFLSQLRRLGTDPAVAGVLVRCDGHFGNWAATQDLVDAITDLRKSKPVWAWVEHPGNGALYAASACEHVWMVPTGEAMMFGVGAELTFFGDLLERLGVQPDFEAAGAYKSFGEPFLRSFASPANQEAIGHLVADLQDQLTEGVANGRRLDAAVVRTAMAQAPLSAAQALDHGLVDKLGYADEARKAMAGKDDARWIEFKNWARADAALETAEGLGQESVAVLYLEGAIVMEDVGSGINIRARAVIDHLEQLGTDKSVHAVVLHINSGGGSALASDVIWRQVVRLAEEKPVIASFEDVSASGGFYLAAPATEIWARPGTLTGSIGVFGGKLVLGDALRKAGIHRQGMPGTPNADFFSVDHRFRSDQRERFKASLQRMYDGFVDRVASGRKTSVEVIEPHCRGRVWTGRDALRLGLVDGTGGLPRALERARDLAGRPRLARRDISGHPRLSLMARLMRGANPARGELTTMLSAFGLDLDAMTLLSAHPDQPLAWNPIRVPIR